MQIGRHEEQNICPHTVDIMVLPVDVMRGRLSRQTGHPMGDSLGEAIGEISLREAIGEVSSGGEGAGEWVRSIVISKSVFHRAGLSGRLIGEVSGGEGAANGELVRSIVTSKSLFHRAGLSGRLIGEVSGREEAATGPGESVMSIVTSKSLFHWAGLSSSSGEYASLAWSSKRVVALASNIDADRSSLSPGALKGMSLLRAAGILSERVVGDVP